MQQQIEERVGAARTRRMERLARQAHDAARRRAAIERVSTLLASPGDERVMRLLGAQPAAREAARLSPRGARPPATPDDEAGERFARLLSSEVGDALWSAAHAEGAELARTLLRAPSALNEAEHEAWRSADELSYLAARHDLMHAAVVVAASAGATGGGALERVAASLTRLPSAALVCFRPLMLTIARQYVAWVASGADRPFPRMFHVQPAGGPWRYAIGFHTGSGPGSGGGFRFILGLARPPPRLAWLATQLLAALNAWEHGTGPCGEALRRLLESSLSPRCHGLLAEASFRALACSGGDEVLLQNEAQLVEARHAVFRHVADAAWRRRYEAALDRPSELRQAAQRMAAEAAHEQRRRVQAARAQIRVPGAGMLAQMRAGSSISTTT